MATLKNSDRAIIDENKLSAYCLNPEHPVGKHKSKMFFAYLGLNQNDAKVLKKIILDGIQYQEAEIFHTDKYGKRFTVDIKIRNLDKEAIVTTGWIIKSSEVIPRLTTCYIKTNN